MIDEHTALGTTDATTPDCWTKRYHRVTDFDRLVGCTFAVESVTEDLPTKQSVLDALEKVLEPSVVIASNTSAIPISVLQQGRTVPGRMVGMHWAEPAHMTRFLELIRGDETSDEAFEATLAMGRRLGKEPIACQKDIPGFIVNRIAYAMYREACHLIELGVADADSIDRSLRNSLGLWASICGPLRWIDITGGPTLYAPLMERVSADAQQRNNDSPRASIDGRQQARRERSTGMASIDTLPKNPKPGSSGTIVRSRKS